MRELKYILLLAAIGILFAHSLSPHHHHVEGKANSVQHDADHHHHDEEPATDTEHEHSPFSFSLMDDCFVTGKIQSAKVFYAPILICYQWLQLKEVEENPSQYYVVDIEVPPRISTSSVPFRGPPIIS